MMEDIRLFRLYDKDLNETGVGIYNAKKGKAVVSMPDKFPKYMVFFLLGSVLRYCDSFLWCCPNGIQWEGHDTMIDLVR